MNIKNITNKLLLISLAFLTPISLNLAAGKSYKAAINAKELLVLMTACDLLPSAKSYNHSTLVLNQMCMEGKQLLKIGMSSAGPGPWTWQPGKMTDHDDFKYAGNAQLSPLLKEKKVNGISLDSAHFYSKWPLFLLSAKNASIDSEKTFFLIAINGLITNLLDNVVSKSESECIIRYKNFIDGTNGAYRWNWQGKGVTYGHSEYGLSYTPFFSSLALLDSDKIATHYQAISDCYPYSKIERKKYFWSRGLEEERLLIMLSTKKPGQLITSDTPNEAEKNYYTKYFAKRLSTEKISTTDAYATVVGDRMLVMHYAFYMNYAPWLNDFHAYANKASQLSCVSCSNDFAFYDELHLLFFLGKYLYLTNEFNSGDPVQTKAIFDRVASKIEDLYLNKQSDIISNYGWDGVVFYSFKDYVNWKLAYYASGNK